MPIFRRTFASALLLGLALPLLVPAGASAESTSSDGPSAVQIIDRVQAFYDKTKTFQANFKQVYYVRATGTRKSSVGKVTFKKKGKMSWRYTNNGNRVVSDGLTIKVYEKANKQMYVQSVKKGQDHRAALSFLLGDGKLKSSFKLRKLNSKKMRFEGGYVLEAVPVAKTPAYRKMLMYIDARTAQVRRVLLLDAQGNRNRFDFLQPVVNQKVADGEFQFTPPPGTRVIRP